MNNAGCFFTQTEIPELKEHGSWIGMAIDPEEWEAAHSCDEDEYECPKCPGKEESDWEWAFY